jgi:hypothetical protein
VWVLLFLLIFMIFALTGWPGSPDVCTHEGVCYCEATAGPAVAQPSNTFSNFGFVLVGLGMLWWMGWEKATSRSVWNNSMTRVDGFFPVLFGNIAVFLGPGSMLFHASMKQWGGFLDSFSMYLFMSFIAVYNLHRLVRMSAPWLFLPVFAAVNTLAVILALGVPEAATYIFAGIGVLALFSQIAVATWGRHIQTDTWGKVSFGVGTGLFVTAFVIWILSRTGAPLCSPDAAIQGHAIWHLLCALVVLCVFIYFRGQKTV